jgi:prolyl-tRNA editing enzyme YbaK/EbsC (Cys-tRNA(Pro) deacylase)
MEIKLGTLNFVSAKEHPEMLAAPVARALNMLPNSNEVGVAEIDPALSDTAAFCEEYNVTAVQAANCVVVEGKRGGERTMAAVVLLASTRADVNGAVCEALDVKKASFAQMEKAVSESNMEFGAITPVGLPAAWPILIDQAAADSGYVIIGSGIRGSKLAVTGSFLAALPNARIINGLAYARG